MTFHAGGTLEPHDAAYSIQRVMLRDSSGGPSWMFLRPMLNVSAIRDLVLAEAKVAIAAGEDAPSVEVRVQAVFGLDAHPMIGSKDDARPLLLKLTSPAGRPIQSTRDLPGFWRGSWKDVQREMKGRYPRHRWPDEPWAEKPSLKTKNAFQRSET